MNNYHLIPYPRKIKENTGFFCGNIGDSVAAYLDGGSEKIRFAPDSSFGQDEYRLDITENGAVITAGSEKAKLYGAVTLGQLVRQLAQCQHSSPWATSGLSLPLSRCLSSST